MNNNYKFGVVVKQSEVMDKIFTDKKTKQRYLDYVYKIGVKNYLQRMIREGLINPSEVEYMYFNVDEHTTATNGRYELREAFLGEFKNGTFNFKWNTYYEPLFPNLKDLTVNFCDSKQKRLVRAADIVANNIYFQAARNNRLYYTDEKTNIILQPPALGNNV